MKVIKAGEEVTLELTSGRCEHCSCEVTYPTSLGRLHVGGDPRGTWFVVNCPTKGCEHSIWENSPRRKVKFNEQDNQILITRDGVLPDDYTFVGKCDKCRVQVEFQASEVDPANFEPGVIYRFAEVRCPTNGCDATIEARIKTLRLMKAFKP